ncbi:MAG: ATP-dependent DNA helicase [Acidobacteria bacterium]|nr:ATP-dependent DNA helicase [Acidobacteriota bacterium]
MPLREELDRVLGPEGEIAANHPLYEHRPGQIRMAQAVGEAIGEKRHLCVEAGTGTGKTLAYLLPIILSDKRVIISTATKNLQEQLFLKDIPFLENALGKKFPVCYLKGRSNYLCWSKLESIDREQYLFSPHDPEYLRIIKKWARETGTGDRAELSQLPDDLPLWHRLDARRETCAGQKCSNFEICFITRARRKAVESDIVVVNHHLFFADLALRQEDFGSILPDYAVLVFDEAHEMEDVATQYFGTMISNYRFEELVRDADKTLSETGAATPYLTGQIARLGERAAGFFICFQAREGRYVLGPGDAGAGIRRGPPAADSLGDTYVKLRSQLDAVRGGLQNVPVESGGIEALVRRCTEIGDELAAILESDSNEHVYWCETRGRGIFLRASPINVAPLLKDRLFSCVDSAILTSATLSTGGNFLFLKSRLGLETAGELIVPSHFDFARQSIFYVPRDIPEPREEGWIRCACGELEAILETSRGRAFVLFTSYYQMEQAYRLLQGRLPFPVMMQGEMSKSGLLELFRGTPNAVLFATSSFWQGVDVQGEQLSCVVIDKLPFSVPSDPVTAARIAHVNASGGNAFYDYQIPNATILLKQGLGRLIRSRTDRGVLALLDKRIMTRSYGRMFLQSLPPAPMTHDRGRVRAFFNNEGQSRMPDGVDAPNSPKKLYSSKSVSFDGAK